ncbi:hypothetical protein L3Q82_004792 [Scortum barcoo]|uniref:Uncharacterized protein n=1 Tax=Scortum barcoo TaxID=214431 RepID=A0ACB8VHJ9_9TELE|nr:hypothetical protein L3Q82_004792 [Scortum barcoo]
MRPYYLTREFTHALVVVVYVPPSANADAACDVLLSAVSRLQTQHPDALLLISFNHASPSSSLSPNSPNGDDREYRGLIQDFADWCLRNNLQINAGKTKELVVDFRRRRHSPSTL